MHIILSYKRKDNVKMKIIFFALLVVILSGCGSSPRFTNNPREGKAPPQINYNLYEDSLPVDTVTGVASYYADKFHGRLTSNGEIYDMFGLTAASPTFPANTILRVTNLKNDRSIIIRVNDHMPYRPDRIIDLSYGTAVELDMVQDGIANVMLEILEWGE